MSALSTLRFEGSYLGSADKISAGAVLECKICWTPYDPTIGDETRQIPPGTPFLALPADWKCPTCDGAKDQFMVVVAEADQSSPAEAGEPPDPAARMKLQVNRLVAEFREIHSASMRNTPLSNESLHVEAIGFRVSDGHYLGVLVAPWFMNLMLLPGPDDDWNGLVTGAKELVTFPSGTYEFIHMQREGFGPYKACSLFSPMTEFSNQLYAGDVARAVLIGLFDERNCEEGDASDRSPDEERPSQDEPVVASRRAVLTGRLGGRAAAPQAAEVRRT